MGEKLARQLLVFGSAICMMLGAMTGVAAASSGPKVPPPSAIAQRGSFQVCVDATYPPAEYTGSNGSTLLGTDISMAKDIGSLFGVKTQFVNTPFSTIIAALDTNKCDAVISAVTDTPQRAKVVNFVDYISVKSAFIVKPGNPEGIHGLANLCGKSVAIILGENWKPFLESQSSKCTSAGKGPVTVTEYNSTADQVLQLSEGRIDAIATSTINAAFVASQAATKSKTAVATPNVPYLASQWGIPVRKNDPSLRAALIKAVDVLYRNGTMKKIFNSYHLGTAFQPYIPK
jgi:polar amino acid transport system substrate-binding protein